MDIFIGILSSPMTPASLSFAFLALLILGFNRNWLVAKGTLDLILKTYTDRIKLLEEALDLERSRNDRQFEIMNKLLSYAETTDRIIRALPQMKGEE